MSSGSKTTELLPVQALVQPPLDRLGLSWENDVEDVCVPCSAPSDEVLHQGFSGSSQTSLRLSTPSAEKLRTALEHSLSNWSILRSVAVEPQEGPPLLVILRCREQCLRQAISSVDEVRDCDALTKIPMSGNHAKGSLPQGLMFRAVIAKAAETKSYGLVILINHAIMDAQSVIMWRNEIEAHLTATPAPALVPHRIFSETNQQLYGRSVPAQQAVEYHLQRLTGISDLRKALWPPSIVSESVMDGSQRSATSSDNNKGGDGTKLNREGPQHLKAIEDPQWRNLQGKIVCKYPSLPTLRSESGIRASTIAKAAVAIFNCLQTCECHAILNQLQSGRSWPFLHEPLAKLLPSPWRVAGPTLSVVTDIIKIDWDESILQMLQRLQTQQRQLNGHQHVPSGSLLPDMTVHDRVVWQAAFRQSFNWQPMGLKPYTADSQPPNRDFHDPSLRFVLEKGYQVDQPMEGCTWECGPVDAEHVFFHVKIDPTYFSEPDVGLILSLVTSIAKSLCSEGQSETTVGAIRSAYDFKSIPSIY